MKYVVDLAAIEWLIDVDLLKFKARVVTQMIEVRSPSGKQIVDHLNVPRTVREQCSHQG